MLKIYVVPCGYLDTIRLNENHNEFAIPLYESKRETQNEASKLDI